MKIKRLLALGLILTLISIIVYNTLAENSDENETDDAIFITPEGMEVESGGISVGDVAPDFQLETLEGEQVKLSDFRGKKVFINFWATWCPPCRAEMPHMQDFYDKYGDDVVVLAVNATGTETNVEKVKKFVKDYELTFPILLDRTNEVNMRFEALSLPTTYFINTEGVIQLQRKVGPMSYEEMESYMKQID
ncbi:redoxin domain-containing protein [Filobacillus milosensis]|uniref:Redoxin domain-containing protein n=1 Tax=Filobacillus milosensis TaxID=94137 RepID=A0A4Y8INE3_9BACI|nr:redoxin domain-containing protein [Filobacillus milosensis]TFB23103.1 redoxin domain-containing protein [Filobacillus milosensis]